MVSLRIVKRAPLGSTRSGRHSIGDHKLRRKYGWNYGTFRTCHWSKVSFLLGVCCVVIFTIVNENKRRKFPVLSAASVLTIELSYGVR